MRIVVVGAGKVGRVLTEQLAAEKCKWQWDVWRFLCGLGQDLGGKSGGESQMSACGKA